MEISLNIKKNLMCNCIFEYKPETCT